MSAHPNVILMAVLKPDGLSRKTMRDIKSCYTTSFGGYVTANNGEEYQTLIMEDDYDENWQISANEGDLIFFDLVTYGYGDVIEWDALSEKKQLLEGFAKELCEKFNCTYKIQVTANYW